MNDIFQDHVVSTEACQLLQTLLDCTSHKIAAIYNENMMAQSCDSVSKEKVQSNISKHKMNSMAAAVFAYPFCGFCKQCGKKYFSLAEKSKKFISCSNCDDDAVAYCSESCRLLNEPCHKITCLNNKTSLLHSFNLMRVVKVLFMFLCCLFIISYVKNAYHTSSTVTN